MPKATEVYTLKGRILWELHLVNKKIENMWKSDVKSQEWQELAQRAEHLQTRSRYLVRRGVYGWRERA